MGIKISFDFAQSMIKKKLSDMDIDAYMNDLGIWSKGLFDNHLIIANKKLECLV